MSWGSSNQDLESLPKSWDGFTRIQKVQTLLDVIEKQMAMVRNGTFDIADGDKVASLILECQLTLADFYADTKLAAGSAKHHVEFVINDQSNKMALSALAEKKKVSETALKREALASQESLDSKIKLVECEREYEKWRCVYDILKEAHILFRNLRRL